jgi:hypothetical protein
MGSLSFRVRVRVGVMVRVRVMVDRMLGLGLLKKILRKNPNTENMNN